MKKMLFYALMLALLGGACSKKQEPSTVASGAAVAPSQTTGITVRLLTDATGIDDKSFNAAAWRGILEFYGDTWNNTTQRGKAYDLVSAQTQDMYIPNIRQAADEQYDLIVTIGGILAL